MLTAEAQNGGARYVGVVDVSGNQSTKIIGILARSAATAFMHQKLDPVNILEHWRRRRRSIRTHSAVACDFTRPARLIQADEFRHLLTVDLRRGKP